MKTIEVFKTNVLNEQTAQIILEEIGSHQPEYKCNFDLEDCDKVLRIENKIGGAVNTQLVINILEKNKHKGTILE